MQQICKKYAKNIPLHRLQHSKYANYMQKMCIKYAQYATKICNKYAINMQNMHKSMYLHILHICTPHFADVSANGTTRHLLVNSGSINSELQVQVARLSANQLNH